MPSWVQARDSSINDTGWLPHTWQKYLILSIIFIGLHTLLLFGTFDVIDLEEMEYGNVAFALLDGHLDNYARLEVDPENSLNVESTGAGRRRRTVWSLEPVVAPFFLLFGNTLLALKLCAIALSSVWALAWFSVARQGFARAGFLLPAILFAVPIPLVQRSTLSATSIFAHLGSSAWHGIALALLLSACARAGPSRARMAAASGFALGIAFSCSFSVAPLGLGVALLAMVALPLLPRLFWLAGTLPGSALFLGLVDPNRTQRAEDLVEGLTGLQSSGPFRTTPGIDHLLSSAETLARFGPGYGEVLEDSLRVVYLDHGLYYSLGLLSAVVLCKLLSKGKPPGPGETEPTAPETILKNRSIQWLPASLLLSFGSFTAVFAATGFRLDPTFFDGLRYLLPLCPAPALLLIWSAQRSPQALRWVLAAAILGAHLYGTWGFFRAEVFPAPWESIVGSEPIVIRTQIRTPPAEASSTPLSPQRWARWSGVSDARRRIFVNHQRILAGEPSTVITPPPPPPFGETAANEYWRGQGIGHLLQHQDLDLPLPLPSVSGGQEAIWFWEGMALGTAYAGCSAELRQSLLERAQFSDLQTAVWYGIGRGDLYCRTCWPLAEANGSAEQGSCCQGHQGSDSCWTGYRDAWRLDYSSGYRYRWTRTLPMDRIRIY